MFSPFLALNRLALSMCRLPTLLLRCYWQHGYTANDLVMQAAVLHGNKRPDLFEKNI